MKHKILGLIVLSVFIIACTSFSSLLTPDSKPAEYTSTTDASSALTTPEGVIPSPVQPENTPASSYRIQIKVKTTSDWTTFRLVGGGVLQDHSMLSVSKEATAAEFNGDKFSLSQPFARAQAGQAVEFVADISLGELNPDGTVTFEIDRGFIGSTQVEITNNLCTVPTLVETLTWDGVKSAGDNTQQFEVPARNLLQANTNRYIVIAQLNFWYYGPGCNGGFETYDCSGKRSTPLTPKLGETYFSSDPAVVNQQIEWAVEYGVDAFSIEWTTPRGVGCCGSMEDTLDDVFLKSTNIQKIRWVIFYDFMLRLMQTPELNVDLSRGIDFDQPDVYRTFVADFVHFAEKYFSNPQYLTIDGRPVVYVWASHTFTGNVSGAIREAREKASARGYDVFIVGDVIQVNSFNPSLASLFDGNTTFTFLIPGLDLSSLKDVGDAAVASDRAYMNWQAQIEGLHVQDRDDLINLQPGWAPQYDDRLFMQGEGSAKYVPAENKEQVIQMATVARSHAQPVGSTGQSLIWLNTWNNWAETTTVEPTIALGPKYPAGNYQFDMLEVTREVFGVETYEADACVGP